MPLDIVQVKIWTSDTDASGKDHATKSDDFLEKIHRLMTFKLIKTCDEEIGSQVTMVLVRDP